MYEDQATSGSGGGWQVDPAQVRAFAAAVAQVRSDLERIRGEVNELSTPAAAPMLGTSPVGQELAEKFTDRMGSEQGLRGQLNLAITRMEEFLTSAEQSAAEYQQVDGDNTTKFKFV